MLRKGRSNEGIVHALHQVEGGEKSPKSVAVLHSSIWRLARHTCRRVMCHKTSYCATYVEGG